MDLRIVVDSEKEGVHGSNGTPIIAPGAAVALKILVNKILSDSECSIG